MYLPDQYINGLSTNELARLVAVKPASIRIRLCETGSYFGVKPMKLPNGRLLWPADSLERMVEYRSKKKEGE